MIHKIWKTNLFLLLIINFSLFLSVNIEPQHNFSLGNSEDLISAESSQKIMNSIDKYSDILVMFRTIVPDLSDYKEIITKQFSSFPVVRVKFIDNDQFLSFIQRFQDEILQIEPVKSIKNILPNNQDFIQKVDSLQSHVNSTGAKILHNSGYTGAGVKIGIIDTGVSDHPIEFGLRINAREVFIAEKYGYS
ncbi:MAG: hypothetical protein ACTSRJ_02460, partial [Candidatus Hodarchaeales archaeon]